MEGNILIHIHTVMKESQTILYIYKKKKKITNNKLVVHDSCLIDNILIISMLQFERVSINQFMLHCMHFPCGFPKEFSFHTPLPHFSIHFLELLVTTDLCWFSFLVNPHILLTVLHNKMFTTYYY